MAKLRLTKSEFRKQKESLKRYTQYLPTLLLKKQQLQAEVNKMQASLEGEKEDREREIGRIHEWAAVFGEDAGIENFVVFDRLITGEENIAGVDIPVFKEVTFVLGEYDLMTTPLWVDDGVEAVKKITNMNAKIQVMEKALTLLREELRTTTQRVNLFEKVKIPESRENIRKIRIFLGDLETAAVVTGKIAKEKIQRKTAEAVR